MGRHIKAGLTIALGIAAAVGLIGLGAIGERMLHKPPSHASSREKAIVSHAAQAHFPVILLGDSFVELADVPQLCGQRALNAGVSGARASDTARLAELLIASERPRLIVVNVGVNDAHRNAMTPAAEVSRDLGRIAKAAKTVGARVTLMGVAPLSGSGLATGFDAVHARVIDDAARRMGALPVPALATSDGLHPNAAGYATWRRIAEQACGGS